MTRATTEGGPNPVYCIFILGPFGGGIVETFPESKGGAVVSVVGGSPQPVEAVSNSRPRSKVVVRFIAVPPG
jgi:hypothetical protein